MLDPAALAGVFVARLPPTLRDAASRAKAALETSLSSAFAGGAEAWPGVSLEASRFVEYLAERIPADAEDVLSALDALHASDLYLACACSSGARRAIESFEARYAVDVDAVVVRVTGSKRGRDEVLSRLRQKLFVGGGSAHPAIGQYSGRSALRTWLNVALVRLTLNVAAGANRELPVEDEILEALPAEGADPELEHFKRLYAAEFRAALAEAIAGLATRERNLLRHGFADGLTIDQIGALYGAHRSTAARWVRGAQQKLLTRLRRALVTRLGVSETELQSIVRLIESRIDVSLRRCLGESAEA
jgi:RNA polymerase sigma-70 factor (ECF subfamily)